MPELHQPSRPDQSGSQSEMSKQNITSCCEIVPYNTWKFISMKHFDEAIRWTVENDNAELQEVVISFSYYKFLDFDKLLYYFWSVISCWISAKGNMHYYGLSDRYGTIIRMSISELLHLLLTKYSCFMCFIFCNVPISSFDKF